MTEEIKRTDGPEGSQPKKTFFDRVKAIYPFFLCFVEIPTLTYLSIPCPVVPVPGSVSPATAPLVLNNHLSNAERLFNKQIDDPQSLLVSGDHIYTGSRDGYLTDLWSTQAWKLARFGDGLCGVDRFDVESEPTCGRPLAMRMDKDGTLLAIDAYNGLFRLTTNNGTYKALYRNSELVHGFRSNYLSDLALGPDGCIYFLDASHYTRNQFHWAALEMSAKGRLLKYNPQTGVIVELANSMALPTGLEFTRDGLGLLITSALHQAIYRYDLKETSLTLWADGLPGMPQSIRYSASSDSYWLALSYPRGAGQPNWLETLAPWRRLRGFLAKFLSLDMWATLRMKYGFGQMAMVAEMGHDGALKRTLMDSTGQNMGMVTEVHNVNGTLYIASDHKDGFIARVPLK